MVLCGGKGLQGVSRRATAEPAPGADRIGDVNEITGRSIASHESQSKKLACAVYQQGGFIAVLGGLKGHGSQDKGWVCTCTA
jgi:hypothetical protein